MRRWVPIGDKLEPSYVFEIDGERLAIVWYVPANTPYPSCWRANFRDEKLRWLYSGTEFADRQDAMNAAAGEFDFPV